MSSLFPALVADIGGSNARFGWVAAPGAPVAHVLKLPVADHPDLPDAVRAYLQALARDHGVSSPPCAAALAVATAVTGDIIDLTNSDWGFSRAALQQALRLRQLTVLNDFEALALALPRLSAAQWRVDGAAPTCDAVMAVVGPGTGLGVASVVPTPRGWVAVPGEGGHATLAAADDLEAAVIARVRRRHEHVSAERLLSGIGLPDLHAALAEVEGHPVETLATPEIVNRALDGADARCGRTLDLFCALLGSFAGNVALTVGARGGLFIGGGIVPRLGERFFASRFRERFVAKGRLRPYLESIPVAVITDTLAALGGAALALEQLDP